MLNVESAAILAKLRLHVNSDIPNDDGSNRGLHIHETCWYAITQNLTSIYWKKVWHGNQIGVVIQPKASSHLSHVFRF